MFAEIKLLAAICLFPLAVTTSIVVLSAIETLEVYREKKRERK